MQGIAAIAAALPGTKLVHLKLNDQGASTSAAAEEALATVVETVPSLLKINLDWKSNQHRMLAEKLLMKNGDIARAVRRASVSAGTPAS